MHEAELMSAALSRAIAVAQIAGAGHIERLTFTYSPTGHVTPESVETLFVAMSAGTIAQGARIVVEPREVTLHCLHCDQDFPADARNVVCTACRRPGVPAGDVPDLVLESIDVDV